MHESENRGILTLNGAAMPDSALARLLGIDEVLLKQNLTTLLTYGVASREPSTGALMCRRMVRDENLRKVRANAGKQGGNPVLLKQKSTTQLKQKSTPSSSSSSSEGNGKSFGTSIPRERNVLLDTLCLESELTEPLSAQPTIWGKLASSLKTIKAASPDVTPSEIRRRCSNYRSHFPKASISSTALASNWGRCAEALARNDAVSWQRDSHNANHEAGF